MRSFSVPGDALPKHGNVFSRMLGRAVLRVSGWTIDGSLPNIPKLVAIAAPHTSNWDFVIGIAVVFALGIRVNWLGKHTIFKKPFASFFRWLGGIPVDRAASHGTVDDTVDLFRNREKMILGLSPEGTRKRVERWKTGFYFIAQRAEVPVILVAIDYGKRRVLLGPALCPSGNVKEDMIKIRDFYSEVKAKYPEKFSTGKEEDGS